MTALALPTAFRPDIAPVAGSLALSALVAVLPLVTVFVTLGVLRWKAHWAGLSAVAVAVVVAWLCFGMPVHLAVLAATEGAAFGVFPIMWIVFTAIHFSKPAEPLSCARYTDAIPPCAIR